MLAILVLRADQGTAGIDVLLLIARVGCYGNKVILLAIWPQCCSKTRSSAHPRSLSLQSEAFAEALSEMVELMP